MCLASASRELRSSFGQWVMARYANCLQDLHDHGYLYCKLFVQSGGFDSRSLSSQFGASAPVPAFRLFEIPEFAGPDDFPASFTAFYMAAEKVPNLLASILVELFRRLQAASLLAEGARTDDSHSQLFEVLQALERGLAHWQSALLGSWNRVRYANERFANIICAIPRAEAERFGVAHWFRRHTKTIILQSVTSSPETLEDVQQDSTSRDCRCVEFLNVLAAVSHCGLTTKAVSSMFVSCILTTVKNDMLDPYGYYGVSLAQILSVLAKVPGDMLLEGAESPKHFLLSPILATCRLQLAARVADAADDLTDNVLRHGLVPARGFSRDERHALHVFQAELLRQ